MKKENLIKQYNLSKKQISLIELYLESLKKTNHHLNLVGSSTLKNPWDRHINDSLQLSKFIPDKKSSIIDLGTGAGLPGLVLTVYGYTNLLLADSKLKKINFIKKFSKESKISVKAICSRVENIKNKKFDFVICRAFAPLKKILHYSLIFTKKNTSLLFLKGRSVKDEINDAKKYFKFQHKLYESKSVGGGYVLNIKKFSKLWLK